MENVEYSSFASIWKYQQYQMKWLMQWNSKLKVNMGIELVILIHVIVHTPLVCFTFNSLMAFIGQCRALLISSYLYRKRGSNNKKKTWTVDALTTQNCSKWRFDDIKCSFLLQLFCDLFFSHNFSSHISLCCWLAYACDSQFNWFLIWTVNAIHSYI